MKKLLLIAGCAALAACGQSEEAAPADEANVAAAEDAGFALGDEVRVVSQLGERTYRLVGTFTFGEARSAAGAVSADVTFAEAQRIAGLEGRTQDVVIAGAEGVDQAELAARVAEVLPPTAEAITGVEAAEQNASEVQEGFAFFRQLLTVFGTIALLVGTFIIANTFSILVAQRTRELALLRAVGASRRQVLGSVLLEAVAVGVVAAVVGLLAGIGLAYGVTAAFAASGADLPSTSLVVRTPTVVLALGTGLLITLVASVIPAVQATRVAPLAALRDVAVDRSGASKLRLGAGVLALVLGAWSLSEAWRSDDPSLATVGLGAVLLLVGSIVIGPVLAEPSVRALGRGLPRLRGITGQLATENAARSPKRTSATASALLIGVALIGFVTIFAASARASVVAEVGRGFTGDLVVQSEPTGFGPPGGFPPSVADAVASIESVETVAAFGFLHSMTTEPLLKQLLRYVMSDEARHVAFGVLSLQEYYAELSAAELRERQEFAFEAAVRMRDRFLQQEVWERMGLEVKPIMKMLMSIPQEENQFQALLFSKIVPNCKKLGLLDANDGWLRKRFEELNVIQFEDWVDTGEEYGEFALAEGDTA